MKRKTPLWRLLAVAGAATLVLAACGDDEEPDAADETEPETEPAEPADTEEPMAFEPVPITIGTLLPQTGALSSIIQALEQPIQMGAEEINAEFPGLVTVESADGGTDPNVASENVDQFLTGEHSAVLGAAASGVSTAIVDKVQAAEVVMCSGSNTAASLTAFDPYYVRTAPSDELQAPTLGDVIIDDGVTDVAVIWRNDEYGAGFGEALATYLTDSGVNVTMQEGYDPNATSYADLADSIAASGAQALAAITFEEGGQLVLDLQGRFDGQVYVADGFVENVGEEALGGEMGLLEGFRGTRPSSSPEGGEATFPDRFAEFAPESPTIFSAHFYDCLMVVTLAAQVAQSADPTVLVNEIVGVTKDGEKCTLFLECMDLIEAGEDIDYDGASGPLDFVDSGQPGSGTYDVYEYAPNAEGVMEPAVERQVLTAL